MASHPSFGLRLGSNVLPPRPLDGCLQHFQSMSLNRSATISPRRMLVSSAPDDPGGLFAHDTARGRSPRAHRLFWLI